jgi:hypothetical protein
MSVEDLLIMVIVAGAGLSGAYLRAELVWWRRYSDAERKQRASLREWHLERLQREETDGPAPGRLNSEQPSMPMPPTLVAISDDEVGAAVEPYVSARQTWRRIQAKFSRPGNWSGLHDV